MLYRCYLREPVSGRRIGKLKGLYTYAQVLEMERAAYQAPRTWEIIEAVCVPEESKDATPDAAVEDV